MAPKVVRAAAAAVPAKVGAVARRVGAHRGVDHLLAVAASRVATGKADRPVLVAAISTMIWMTTYRSKRVDFSISVRVEPFGWLAAAQDKLQPLAEDETPGGTNRPLVFARGERIEVVP